MANNSVNHLRLSLQSERELDAQDNLFENLHKAQALLQLATLSDNFVNLKPATIHNCIWTISELVDAACQALEDIR